MNYDIEKEVSLLHDVNAPLDHDVLSTIASTLLNADPQDIVDIPLFRIRELIVIAERSRTSLPNEFRLTDAVMAFYAICLYFTTSTNFDLEIVVEAFTLMQYLAYESLMVEQNMRSSKGLEMGNLLEIFKKDEKIDTEFKLEIFSDGLELARTIVRDALYLSRTMNRIKEMKAEERKTAIPKHCECIQPYCIYYVANLALLHITAVLHDVGNLILCPGLVEHVVLSMITGWKRKSTESSPTKYKSNTNSYTFEHCIREAQKLGIFVGHFVLDNRILEYVTLFKAKISKVIKHPGISYILYRVSPIRTILGIKGNGKNTNDPPGLGSKKLSIHQPGFHYLNDCTLQMDVQNEPKKEDSEMDSASVANKSVQDSLESGSINPSIKMGSVSEGGSSVVSKLEAEFTNLDKKTNHFWALKRTFRSVFITFDRLQQPNEFISYFGIEYCPTIKEFPSGNLVENDGIKSMTFTGGVKYLEGLYYSWSRRHLLPRSLNPLEESYWIAQYIFDFLAKMASAGEGFCPSLEQEKEFLQRKIKSMTDKVNKPKKGKEKSVSLPVLSSSTTKPNLGDLLNKAKLEAQIESRIHRIDFKLKGWDKVVDQPKPEEKSNTDPQLSLLLGVQLQIQKKEEEKVTNKSVIWMCRPKEQLAKKRAVFAGVDKHADNPLENMPTKTEALEYAKRLEEERLKKQADHIKFKQFLEDQQEAILAKNRAAKAASLRTMREKMKEEISAQQMLKKEWEEERRRAEVEKLLAAQRAAKEKEEAELREKYRIQEINEMKRYKKAREEEELEMQLERERRNIEKLLDSKEVEEIIRRNQEEERMKYLEERRRVIEQRNEALEQIKLQEKQQRKEKTLELVDKFQARVRMGNFMWHNGVYGFYDSVRKKPVDYIEYEDENGDPYYYDPINKSYQRRRPNDAPIRHYTEDERKEYDAIYGEGAYDAMKADRAFKDNVNKYGGYYDDDGNWIAVTGYYDENYEWVQNEGYYNEQGRFIKYAKVQGDLSFMV